MWRIAGAILALVAAGVAYFFVRLYQMRKEMEGLPQPPRKSWLLGNLDVAAECQKAFPPDAHPHAYGYYIRQKYGLGKFFYVDWWPLGPRWLFVADPEISSTYITTTQSLPKSPLETRYLNMFLGKNNLVSLEGAHWKSLRAIFNPGFAAAHLMTLIPYIVDASVVFCDVLRRKAESGELIELENEATNLTIDIIGKVVLDSDLNAQKAPHPIVTTFRHQLSLMPPPDTINPFSGLDLTRPFKLRWNARKLDRLIGEELDRKVTERAAAASEKAATASGSTEKTTKKSRNRSVVDLALDTYESTAGGPLTSPKSLPASFRTDIIDSMKTFIFAGHDTTASTIAYVFYLLHLYPAKHARVTAELDALLPRDVEKAAEMIKEDVYVTNKLEYTTAVVKEVLRLFPPASTLRYLPSEKGAVTPFIADTDTEGGSKAGGTGRFPLFGFELWPMAHTIMRNDTFFPQPEAFLPERFIQAETPFPEAQLFTPRGKDAWRPFEKGPRHCIGQELAMIETRIILALTLRGFGFVAEFAGGKVRVGEGGVDMVSEITGGNGKGEKNSVGAERRTIEGHQCYQVLKGSAKPRGGMPGRVFVRE